jgi:hypothetical protein
MVDDIAIVVYCCWPVTAMEIMSSDGYYGYYGDDVITVGVILDEKE